MANHINSASRILDILNKIKNRSDKEKNYEVWASVFGIEETNFNKLKFKIPNHLEEINSEMEVIEEYMLSANFEKNLYSQYLSMIRGNILSPHALLGECISMKSQINNELLLCIGFCKDILPNEDLLIDSSEVDELKLLLISLEEKLISSSISTSTKNIIQKNIEKIRSALRSYKIVGAKAISSVAISINTELIINQKVLSEADSETVDGFKRVLHKLGNIADKIIKTNNAVNAGVNLAHYGAKLLELLP